MSQYFKKIRTANLQKRSIISIGIWWLFSLFLCNSVNAEDFRFPDLWGDEFFIEEDLVSEAEVYSIFLETVIFTDSNIFPGRLEKIAPPRAKINYKIIDYSGGGEDLQRRINNIVTVYNWVSRVGIVKSERLLDIIFVVGDEEDFGELEIRPSSDRRKILSGYPCYGSVGIRSDVKSNGIVFYILEAYDFSIIKDCVTIGLLSVNGFSASDLGDYNTVLNKNRIGESNSFYCIDLFLMSMGRSSISWIGADISFDWFLKIFNPNKVHLIAGRSGLFGFDQPSVTCRFDEG